MSIRPRWLARGLLVVSVIGVGPLVALAAFSAGVVYSARFGTAVLVLAIVAMILQLVGVVLFSKVVVDLAGAAITSMGRAVMSALPWSVFGAPVGLPSDRVIRCPYGSPTVCGAAVCAAGC